MAQLKYQDIIDTVTSTGCSCPPENAVTRKMTSFRYIFEIDINKHNHLPNKKISPMRQLKDDIENCSACALSCFNSENNAVNYYQKLLTSHPKIHKNIGDSLSMGDLKESDGLITEIDATGHFDFFEEITFDPSLCFTFLKKILVGTD